MDARRDVGYVPQDKHRCRIRARVDVGSSPDETQDSVHKDPLPLVLSAPAAAHQSASARAKHAKEKMNRNKWICTCAPDLGKGAGKRAHVVACKREIFERQGSAATDPELGEVVHCLSCAGRARAGPIGVTKSIG